MADAPALHIHTCTNCGKVAPWGPTWRWYSDGFDKSRTPWWAGDPVCKWKACSFACARAIDPKAPTDEELARKEAREEAREKRAGRRDDWSGVTGQTDEQLAPPRRRKAREPYKTKTELKRELAEARRRIAELEGK